MPDTVEGEKVVDVIQPDKDGKHPESIPWDKYVGIKEAWGRAKEKVSSLEEKLKTTVAPEELTKVRTELETTKVDLKKASDELIETKNKTLSEKREVLTKRGLPGEKVKDMSDKELDAAIMVLGSIKPGADMGGGGGGANELKGSPMELATRAYATKK